MLAFMTGPGLSRRAMQTGAALLAAAFVFMAAPIERAFAAELTVTVEGIRNAQGFMELSVFTSAAEWPDHPQDKNHQKQPAQAGSVVFKFNLPPGRYAAAGYHDENGNGKFDKSMLGLPEEGYTLSNNAKPFLSAPAWDKVSFSLPASGASISMKMIYP